MGCFVALLALVTPRLVLALLWFFTDYLSRAFGGTWIWPLLGFFFLPLTTLAYAWTANSGVGLSPLGIAVLVIAFLFDVGAVGGGGRHYRRRRDS